MGYSWSAPPQVADPLTPSRCTCNHPQTYIHRSGRTGRAGATGICITLVDRKKEGLIPYIQVRLGRGAGRLRPRGCGCGARL